MLTEEQKELMEGILNANNAILNDTKGVDAIASFDAVNGSLDIKNEGIGAPYNQCVTIHYSQAQPIMLYFYTSNLITGYGDEAVQASRDKLAELNASEIENKLSELKNII